MSIGDVEIEHTNPIEIEIIKDATVRTLKCIHSSNNNGDRPPPPPFFFTCYCARAKVCQIAFSEKCIAMLILSLEKPVLCCVIGCQLRGCDYHGSSSCGDDTTIQAGDSFLDIDGLAGMCNGCVPRLPARPICLQSHCICRSQTRRKEREGDNDVSSWFGGDFILYRQTKINAAELCIPHL